MARFLLAAVLALAILIATATPSLANKGCADTNKDDAVNSIDAARILQVVAGLYDPGLILLHMWDADDDLDITSIDAALILQYDAALIKALPGCV
jgi:hypothetical protein